MASPVKHVECTTEVHSEVCKQLRDITESSKEEKVSKLCQLKSHLINSEVSLSDKICSDTHTEPHTSVLTALLRQPDGHLMVHQVLDSLVDTSERGKVKLRLGSGLLYRPDGQGETEVLDSLLQLTGECARRRNRSTEAVRGILRHPVMEAFIREKWRRVEFVFFHHIG